MMDRDLKLILSKDVVQFEGVNPPLKTIKTFTGQILSGEGFLY